MLGLTSESLSLLMDSFFAHGQLYVALSRATSGQWIKVLLSDKATQFATPNVVYCEILVDW